MCCCKNKIICQNKHIEKFDKFEVVNTKLLKHYILYSDCCQYVGSKEMEGCNKCFGKIILSYMYQYDKDLEKWIYKENTYRDRYTSKKGKIKKILEATLFLNSLTNLKIIKNKENNSQNQKTTIPWLAYDKPDDYKIICLECKNKNKITPCKDVENNIKNGKPENFCPIGKQKKIKIY